MAQFSLHSFQGVLFDLDGVLVDSYDCWFRLLQDSMREQGKTPVTAEEFHSRWGQGIEADRDAFFPEWTMEQLTRFYEQRFPGYTGFTRCEPGADLLLKRLRQSNRKIAIASNSPTLVIEDLLRSAGLIEYPHLIVGADQVKEAKPAPDMLYKALEGLCLRIEEACYVGDSIFDSSAADAAGMFFVGYKRPGMVSVQNLDELSCLF